MKNISILLLSIFLLCEYNSHAQKQIIINTLDTKVINNPSLPMRASDLNAILKSILNYPVDTLWVSGDSIKYKISGVIKTVRFTGYLDSLIAIQSRIQTKQPLGSYLVAGNNLADVTNIATARSNLGTLAISDSVSMLAPYARTQRLTDSLAAAQIRIQTKEPLIGYTTVPNTRTINGHALSADVTVTKSDVGLGNVPNVDATNASNITSGTLADVRLSGNVTLQGNSFNGANQLVKTGSDGKLLPGVIPALALVDTYTLASQAAMLALPAEQGDIAIRTDINVAYILYQAPASTLGNWIALPAPSSETDPVYTASSWFGTTNNSSNWNTAYGWGNHATAGYLSAATAATTYLPLSGGTLTGGLSGTTALFSALPAMGSNTKYFTMYDAVDGGRLKYTTVANVQSYLGLGSAAYTSSTDYTAANTETLSSVTGRGGTTTSPLTFSNGTSNNYILTFDKTSTAYSNVIAWSTGGAYKWQMGGRNSGSEDWSIYSTSTLTDVLRLNYTTGAATFAESVNVKTTNPSGWNFAVGGSTGNGFKVYYGASSYNSIFDTYGDASYGGIVRVYGIDGVTSNITIRGDGQVTARNFVSNYSSITNTTGSADRGLNITYSYSGSTTYGAVIANIGGSTTGYGLFVYSSGSTTSYAIYSQSGLNYFGGASTFASTVTASAFYESSDIYQKIVHTTVFSPDGIDAIQYTFKPNGTKKWGYSAQQVQKILPYAVTKGSDGFLKLDYTTVHTYKLSEHDTEILDLKKRISQLEKQLKR